MARRPGATQDEMRRHNVSMLLRLVHVHGAVSRAELTSLMGLSRSTIKALVSELTDAGLVVEEVPAAGFGAGRPSYVVMPRSDTAYVLGANVGVDSVGVAAVGLGGTVLARREYRIKGLGAKPDAVAGRLASEMHRLVTQLPRGAWPVGVGVGVPGIVRRSDGHVELAPNLTWRDVPFGTLLERRLGLDVPLRVANDGDVGAMAEHVRGAGRGIHTMLYIAGEVGIGGGLVVDGRMLHGAGGYAGEIGHITVNPAGRGCRCGSVGCLETEVGEEALLRAAGREPLEGRRGYQQVLAQAVAGDPVASQAVHGVAQWLARGVASLVNVFNPELVVFGGPLSGLYLAAQDVLRSEISRLALEPSWQRVRLAVPELGADSMVLGAAELAFEWLLGDPMEEAGPARRRPPAAGDGRASHGLSAGMGRRTS